MHDQPKPPMLDLRKSLKKPMKWALEVGLFSALAVQFLPNYYKSEARYLPVDSKGLGGNLGGLASAAAAFGVNVPGGDSSDANFVDILNSRSLKEYLLQSEFQYHIRSWRFGPERVVHGTLYDFIDEKNKSKALKKLDKYYSASRDIKSKITSVMAETRSPDLSQLD